MLFREATRMIHIEHLAFWTRDLERLAAFYAEAFGAAVLRMLASADGAYVNGQMLQVNGGGQT